MIQRIKDIFDYIWLHGWLYRTIKRTHATRIKIIRKKGKANVVFTALDITMWRYQHLYEMMKDDPRFNVTILLTPCPYRDYEKDLKGLREFFNKQKIPFIDFNKEKGPIDIKKELDPDILFYTQPYDHLLIHEYDFSQFYDRLLCYCPYAFWTASGKSSYNLAFHNLAWRLYYSTSMHKKDAYNMAANKGSNVRVVGYTNADDFLKPHHSSPWKEINDGKKRKRIIWAPHFTIKTNTIFPPRSNFLWMAEIMVNIAKEYSDTIQIAFKPHPSLMKLLYEQDGWGKERTEAYYQLWATMPNTQLETGEFINLFMTSDGMIHDCASFTVEYHYSKKPVMFMSKDLTSIQEGLNDFGKKAFSLQYFGSNANDIQLFINETILGENDPMYTMREEFYQQYLIPPNKNSVAKNIYNEIVKSLYLA